MDKQGVKNFLVTKLGLISFKSDFFKTFKHVCNYPYLNELYILPTEVVAEILLRFKAPFNKKLLFDMVKDSYINQPNNLYNKNTYYISSELQCALYYVGYNKINSNYIDLPEGIDADGATKIIINNLNSLKENRSMKIKFNLKSIKCDKNDK